MQTFHSHGLERLTRRHQGDRNIGIVLLEATDCPSGSQSSSTLGPIRHLHGSPMP